MTNDKFVNKNIKELVKRSETGINKYETTLERTDLNFKDWVQHAIEETLDLANYLQVIKDRDLQKPTDIYDEREFRYFLDEIYHNVVEFNKNRNLEVFGRNPKMIDRSFMMALVYHELAEFYKWSALYLENPSITNKTEVFDALIDMVYLLLGCEYRFGNPSYLYADFITNNIEATILDCFLDEERKNIKELNEIYSWIFSKLADYDLLHYFDKGFTIVHKANMLKSSKKNASGKIIKGDYFYNPHGDLFDLISQK